MLTCHAGPLPKGTNILIGFELRVDEAARTHTSATFIVALNPIAPDTFQATSVRATVDVLGAAHLRLSIVPRTATVIVGKQADLFATAHNDGPDPASDAALLALAGAIAPNERSDGHFVITNGTDVPFDLGAARNARPRTRIPTTVPDVRTMVERRLANADPTSSVRFWMIGTIAEGHTAVVDVRVKATSVGKSTLVLIVGADTTDPQCQADFSQCNDVAVAGLTAVAAPAGSGPPLANTGSGDVPELLALALLMLALGAALSFAGRKSGSRLRLVTAIRRAGCAVPGSPTDAARRATGQG